MVSRSGFIRLILVMAFCPHYGQNVDSLKALADKSPSSNIRDTMLCSTLSVLILELTDRKEQEKYNHRLRALSERRAAILTRHDPLAKVYERYAAQTYNVMGYFYMRENAIQQAIQTYSAAINLYREAGDKYGLAQAYVNLGNPYFDMGDLSRTLEYNKMGLKLFEELGDKRGIASCYNVIAFVYRRQNNMKQALYYYNKSYVIFLKEGAHYDVANYFNALAEIYLSEKQLKEAIRYQQRALKLYEEYGDKPDIANAKNNMGHILMMMGDSLKGVEFYLASLKIREDINHQEGIANSLTSLASFYLSKKNYPLARQFAERALKISREIHYTRSTLFAATILKDIYKGAENYREALEMTELWAEMKDSLLSQNTRKEIVQKQLQYEFEKKEIVLKEEQNKLTALYFQKSKDYMLVGIISVSFLIALFILIYLRYKYKKEKEKHDLVLQLRDSEIKALQAQMNPHFIFNALNSVLEVIRKGKTDEALKYLTKFSRLIRYVLEASRKRTNPLADEIELLKLYIDLENLRFGDSFNYAIEVDKELDTRDTEIPTMLLQPFIENSILHGLRNKQDLYQKNNEAFTGNLSLIFKRDGKFLRCIITDNGIGRQAAAEIKLGRTREHLSIGMRITSDLLSMLDDQHYKIEFTDLKETDGRPAGTRVEIMIPLHENF